VTLPFSTVAELKASAGAGLPAGGVGLSWPTPVREQGVARVALFWFRCSHDPSVPPWLRPPHRLFVLDGETAKIVRSAVCSPADFGFSCDADRPLEPPPSRAERSYRDFRAWRARLAEISPAVWAAWAAPKPPPDEASQRRVAAYLELFAKVEMEELMPWYEALGVDFFGWARTVAAGAARSTT
jgi:hypothetical protein